MTYFRQTTNVLAKIPRARSPRACRANLRHESHTSELMLARMCFDDVNYKLGKTAGAKWARQNKLLPSVATSTHGHKRLFPVQSPDGRDHAMPQTVECPIHRVKLFLYFGRRGVRRRDPCEVRSILERVGLRQQQVQLKLSAGRKQQVVLFRS